MVTTNGVSTNQNYLIGKSVQILQFDDGYEWHIITTITGISNGMLQTSDWYCYSSSEMVSNNPEYNHCIGTHYIAISTINGMWECKIPEIPMEEKNTSESTPGMGIILALLALSGMFVICKRSS